MLKIKLPMPGGVWLAENPCDRAVGRCGARLHSAVARQDPAAVSPHRALPPGRRTWELSMSPTGTGMVIVPPLQVQQLLLLLRLHLRGVLALNGGHTPVFSSSFEMHKIAGECHVKVFLTLKSVRLSRMLAHRLNACVMTIAVVFTCDPKCTFN